ncbi:MAG: hypothetical protein ABI321_05410 [Polyangia bacterium]
MRALTSPSLLLSLLLPFALAACHHAHPADGDLGVADLASAVTDLAGADLSGPNPTLSVTPDSQQTLTVTRGMQTPTIAFSALLGTVPVEVVWSVDRGDLASIDAGPSSTGTVTPTGTTGGLLNVTARLGQTTIVRQVLIKLVSTPQNGFDATNPDEQKQVPTSVGDLSSGGGVGGVGGEGLGGPVTDPATITALGAPTDNGASQNLKLVYPYDGTIWPRGMLAPLLMWTWSQSDADAIKIDLTTTSGSFSWSGTFAKPQFASAFIRHPIPQDVWTAATETAGGTVNGAADKLIVKVTLARSGVGYGPVTQTWPVAPVHLTGTVYYNSYGTKLVKNWTTADKAGHPVGAAILSVRSGDTGPKLVIGKDSPLGSNGIPTNDSGCRVCHIVASRGRFIIAQAEAGTPNNGNSWLYDLNATDVQGSGTLLSPDGTFAWAGMVGDGSYALGNAVNPSSSNPGILNASSNTATSQFWQFGPSPLVQPLTGLTAGLAAGYPSYSPDDTQVAFVDVTGSNATLANRPLKSASYDATTHAFSNEQTLYTPANNEAAGYPGFLPDNSAVVFEHQIKHGGDTVVTTRSCARSELYWNKTGMNVALDAANGHTGAASYLPTAAMNHGIYQAGDPRCGDTTATWDDTSLNYEPTVLPVIEGGYAWVVFTSRRLYGNQLTQYPYNSWPADYDTTSLAQAPVKKLWVTAIDLNAAPGTDPSHPAFYLPAQEILAGNSRGFWVLDPCKSDGLSCASGDQCCNGFCEPDPGNPKSLVCGNTAVCANVQDKCTTAADCCDASNTCVNGFCAAAPPIN